LRARGWVGTVGRHASWESLLLAVEAVNFERFAKYETRNAKCEMRVSPFV
jgi:hypothetical protein